MRFAKFRFLSLSLFLIFGLFIASSALAASASSIAVNVAPENPSPNENTTITLSSYAYNLDTVMITWSVNGKTALSGIGKKTFSITAGSAGSEASMVAKMDFPDGTVSIRVSIKPAVMVMLWEATDSYVPPFYKGKALATLDSELKVVAMPEIHNSAGGNVSPTSMTYAWQKDYSNDQSASGYGKNFYVYTNDYLDGSNNISVVASTIEGQSGSEANINIGTTNPEISFYKKNEALGTVWESALSDGYKIQGSEIIVAIPYFISPKEIRVPSLLFSWAINGNPITASPTRKNIVPLKAQEGTSGTANLSLEITNQNKIFETAKKEINLSF